MKKLFESYLAGLIKYETRSNPNPLLEATELPDVFLIREKVGDAPTIIRVTVSPILAPAEQPPVEQSFTAVYSAPVAVGTSTATVAVQPELVTVVVADDIAGEADGDDETADGSTPSTTGDISRRRKRK
jgi:hypothetical protein